MSPFDQISPFIAALPDALGGMSAEWMLIGGFLLALMFEIYPQGKLRRAVPWVILGSMLGAGILAGLSLGGTTPKLAFAGMIQLDRVGAWAKILVLVPAMVSIGLSRDARSLRNMGAGMGEYYLLMAAMTIGMAFLVMSSHFLMIFLALEMVSLPAYILTAYNRLNRKGLEASLKYVIFGCFSSGVMIYGISWLYGLTGTLDPTQAAFAENFALIAPFSKTVILLLVFGGLAFKIGLVPFHFWVPDVYEGAPYPIASFFAVAPKVAAFVAMIRMVFVLSAGGTDVVLAVILGTLAVASMLMGNLSALGQTNIRRMLGYSSVAQAGYILVGLAVISDISGAAVLFYLTAYTIMTFGGFLMAGWMHEKMGTEVIEDLRGAAQFRPGMAVIMMVLMASLIGLPPTMGFIAKLEIILSAMTAQGQLGALAVVLVIALLLNTVISLFYYIRPAAIMVLKNPQLKSFPGLHGWQGWVLSVFCLLIILLGIIFYDGLFNFFGTIAAEIHG